MNDDMRIIIFKVGPWPQQVIKLVKLNDRWVLAMNDSEWAPLADKLERKIPIQVTSVEANIMSLGITYNYIWFKALPGTNDVIIIESLYQFLAGIYETKVNQIEV